MEDAGLGCALEAVGTVVFFAGGQTSESLLKVHEAVDDPESCGHTL